jgi:hypothetical protein|tara:strand:- start:659 stop:856 length:198 start_codon:yes stop_codon:yes gene_type:complete
MTCEHEWKIYEVDDWDDMGTEIAHVQVSLICAKCGAAARTDFSWDYSAHIRNIDLSFCDDGWDEE